MTEDELLARYGIIPKPADVPFIRDLIQTETANGERESNEFLKALCTQLFAFGEVSDSLHIWRAKQSSFDAACYIDIQLLCGAGLEKAKDFLGRTDNPDAKDALVRLSECEKAGEFDGFAISEYLNSSRQYYGIA